MAQVQINIPKNTEKKYEEFRDAYNKLYGKYISKIKCIELILSKSDDIFISEIEKMNGHIEEIDRIREI